jgi:hypothetical protein
MCPAQLLTLAQTAPVAPEYIFVREGAVGWGTLSLINAGLAQGKGRSGLAWFLLSILLGPIATLLIVVLERVPINPKV